MKVTIEYAQETTIEEFADKHGLEMIVTESVRPREYSQFSAHFKGQTYPHEFYRGLEYGFGKSPEEAIADYASKIQGGSLYFSSPTKKDKQATKRIDVPRLIKRSPPGTMIPVPIGSGPIRRGFFSRLFS